MWKRRWVGLAATWIVGVAAVVAVMRMPDVYEASARIYVDTQSVLKPLMQGLAVQPNVDQQVMILSRTLISRPNVEKLIRMADLDLGTKIQIGTGRDGRRSREVPENRQPRARQSLYPFLPRSEARKGQAGGAVAGLDFHRIEPWEKRKDSDSAKKFIDEQVKVYEKKLEEAEDRLKEFKIRNLSSNEGLEKDYFTRMSELTAQLNRSRLELREAENSRDALKRELSGEEPILLPDDTRSWPRACRYRKSTVVSTR